MKKKIVELLHPVNFKFTIFLVVFIVIVFTAVFIISLLQLKDVATMVYTRMGLPALKKAAQIIDGDAFEKLVQTLDKNDPFYAETQLKLLSLREEADARYLYTMAPHRDNIWIYIIDGEYPAYEGFSDLGDMEDISHDYRTMMKAIESGLPQANSFTWEKQWGWSISIFMPILNSNNKAVGIIGCDYDVGNILKSFFLQFMCFIVFAILVTILALRVYSMLINQIDKRNNMLIQLRKTADAATKAKGSFLANTSHELRTPMNAVIGLSELSLQETISANAREYISGIHQAGTELLSIINNVLDFSKIESGKLELTEAEYPLSALLENCVNFTRKMLKESQPRVRLEFTTSTYLPRCLLGDELRIRQVLINVLDNAVKFTEDGTINFTVQLESPKSTVETSPINTGDSDADYIILIFKISDTGRGINKSDQKKIFDVFFRVKNSANSNTSSGVGLGLSIAQSFLDLMGGSITVSSVPGSGSTFTITLPQIITDPAPLVFSWKTNTQEEHFIYPDANVMVVDDNSTNLIIMQGLLASYRVTPDTCISGAEAVQLVQKNSYDLIFMDHLMPDMDGIETVAAIRDLDISYVKDIPVIALTANANSGIKEMFLEKGFNDYLSKPIDISQLYEIMKRWIPNKKKLVIKNDKLETLETTEPADDKNSQTEKSPGNNYSLLIKIGVDVLKGISITGGTDTAYQKVLKSFYKDAKDRLEFFAKMPKIEELSNFTISVHALKSAMATIGAMELSKKAAALEGAGKTQDIEKIRQELGRFHMLLENLIKHIGMVLEIEANEDGTPEPEEIIAQSMPLWTELVSALKAENIDVIRSILMELENKPFDTKIQEILNRVSNAVMMSEFEEASNIITELQNR